MSVSVIYMYVHVYASELHVCGECLIALLYSIFAVKIVMQPRDAQGFVSGIVSLQCKAKLLGPASTTGTTIQ